MRNSLECNPAAEQRYIISIGVNSPLPSSARGCVVIAGKGGEAVGFPAYRQAGKGLECGSFRLWEIVACIRPNVFIWLVCLNPNG
jgi:hypothetical protein